MKQRFLSWTALAALCTALVVGGCSGTDNNPFGSSGGSGSGGGGAVGAIQSQVLLNGAAGYYNGLTLTVSPIGGGPADPLVGDASSTLIDLSQGNNAVAAYFCPLLTGVGPECGMTASYPLVTKMSTWTLAFDLEVAMANPANLTNIVVSWGPGQCARSYTMSNFSPTYIGTFATVSIPSSQFIVGATGTCNSYVNAFFGVTCNRVGGATASTPIPGDAVYIDNVRWIQQ